MKILFVCSGNTCRSPMAEGMAHKILGTNVHVESAGTHAHVRDPPPVNAVKIMRHKFGVDISSHRSRSVYDVHIENFDYVVPMADDVYEDLKRDFPSLREKLLPSWRIDDPYHGDMFTYEITTIRIEKDMEELSKFLKKEMRA
jgi:protein-tyrosine-phosphatase